jgi:heme exporter protein B
MMGAAAWTRSLWWLICKDLVREFRSRLVWPAMLVLGIVIVLVLQLQWAGQSAEGHGMVGGLLWVAVFFAGTLAMDRSISSEREEGCWKALLLYPLSPTTIYLAKVAVNVIALACLECVLVPAFIVLADAPLLARPAALLAVVLPANLGIAAIGTLLSALTQGIRRNGHLLTLLLLPLALPIVLAAAESTRLTVAGDTGATWWRWVQLLGVAAAVFLTAGILMFEFAIED